MLYYIILYYIMLYYIILYYMRTVCIPIPHKFACRYMQTESCRVKLLTCKPCLPQSQPAGRGARGRSCRCRPGCGSRCENCRAMESRLEHGCPLFLPNSDVSCPVPRARVPADFGPLLDCVALRRSKESVLRWPGAGVVMLLKRLF